MRYTFPKLHDLSGINPVERDWNPKPKAVGEKHIGDVDDVVDDVDDVVDDVGNVGDVDDVKQSI